MPQFKEWLAEQAAQRTSINQRQQRVEDWTTAVAHLMAQMVRWLAEDDTQNILTVETARLQKAEEGLGPYETTALRISLSPRLVDVIPVARNVVGGIGGRGGNGFRSEGRVDMTNGADKFMLYRAVTPSEKKWVIVDKDDFSVRDLNKETFEAAIQDLFS